MSVAKEMKGIRKVVHALLVENVRYRDSDRVLVARIWSDEMGGKDALKTISGFDLMCEYVNDKSKLTNAVSIVRMRRDIQEHNVELQGKSYIARKKASKDVKKFLGYKTDED
jgi:hypothetical protein